MTPRIIAYLTQAFFALSYIVMLTLIWTAYVRRRELGFMLIGIGASIGVVNFVSGVFFIDDQLTPSHTALVMNIVHYANMGSYLVTLTGWAFIAFKKPSLR